MMKKVLFLTLLATIAFTSANALPRQLQSMKNAARKAINEVRAHKQQPAILGEITELHKTSATTILGFENGGFAVIANDDKMPEVLGVSDAHFSGTANPNFQWWLNAINKVCEAQANGAPAYASGNVPTPAQLGFEPRVDAIVSAEWDQEAPYSNMCPKDKNNYRCLTGCVATAISQVLYTHRTPINGQGTRTNKKSYQSYQNPNGSYEDITFTYDGYVPDYDNMIDRYTSGPKAGQYTQEQADAVAELMLACGVAVNMDYGSDGSGAYTDQATLGLIQYMGITTADFKERDDYSDTQWMTMVYEELAGGHAMYYSAVDSNPWTGGGHAFVCDGYNEQGEVHINWGWSGDDNGFYNINLLNPSYYQFSLYQDFIRGLWDPYEQGGSDIKLIDLAFEDVQPGTLKELIGDENLAAVESIVLAGELNEDDMELLKTLASGTDLTEMGLEESKGHLKRIDLSDAILPNDEIADNAFADCAILSRINLPRKLARIGNNAFNGCSRLIAIRSYTYAVPQMGTRVFDGVSKDMIYASFIANSTEYYKRNAQWKNILTDRNTSEFGTTLKAKNATRYEGENNPVFGFSMYGNRVTGTPHLWTEADETSPAGKYAINIEAGTITNVKDICFVAGTLTVKESTASAISNVKTEGSESNVYNTAGVRTETAGNGLYIVNGKKIAHSTK